MFSHSFFLSTKLLSATLVCVGLAWVSAAQTVQANQISITVSPTDAAIKKASMSANASPKSERVWSDLGDAYMQKARETADASYYTRAEAAYRKALAIDEKSVTALAGMAWVNGGRHEFEASIDWAKKALAINPKLEAAYGLIGDAALEMGDYEGAFEQYQKMLDSRPDLASYGRSAHLLQVTGDTRRASWLLAKAIASGGPFAENTAWCRSQLALVYFSQGGYVPAQQVLDQGLKLAPNDFHLLAVQGRVKAAVKDYDGAIASYKKASEIAPQQDVVAALGDLYMLTGKTDDAKKQYALVESIARINEANGVRGDMLTARFYADHDIHLTEALAMAEKEYKTRKNVYAADNLAWCYYKNGNIDEARKYIRLALKQNTPEALFRFHKGMIYAKAGDRVVAQQALYEAMSINPQFDPMFAPVAMKTMEQLGSAAPGDVAMAAK